ncbi:uncharacterized protein LOC134278844 [Saccostrea cucullata]|uniref:uncharacterized protein LOC134278844 n=1 Tax=Saccostrea cuccullata TaxID=36930 RepID=UPI002ED162F6
MEYKDLTAAITKHGVDFHKKIDQAVEKLHSKVEESKTNQLRILHAHLDDIKKKSSKIKGELNSINFVLDSQDFLKLSSFTFTIETFRKLPQKIMPFCATFTPRQIQGEELCTLFGLISSGKLTSEEHGYSFRDSSEAECISPVKQLLDKPKILTTLETKFEKFLNNVACVSEDEIWTSGNVCTMKRFNIIQSSLLEEVYLEDSCIPGDIAVTKHDYLVYTDPKERTVNIVKNEEKILIELENWKPCSICSTSSGDLLLTMDNEYSQSKVVRYSGFMVTQSIQFDDKGRHLYSSGDMKYVSENKNLDICVADSRAKAVVVVNKVGKLRFRYTGHHSFTPLGISTDSQSQILTADLNNHCVHIINQDGQFLRYIMCGLSYPWGLCTDKNDNLFVAQWRNRQVKKIKYLQ